MSFDDDLAFLLQDLKTGVEVDRERIIYILERALKIHKIMMRGLDEMEQAAGKALGYPWFKDDQKNFPGATAADGVCIGEHVTETIVAELAAEYVKLKELKK